MILSNDVEIEVTKMGQNYSRHPTTNHPVDVGSGSRPEDVATEATQFFAVI